jgi:hypothetical protein
MMRSILRLAAAALIPVAMTTLAPASARAGLALTFTGGDVTAPFPNIMAGWTFRVGTAINVTSLGVWDQGGDGLGESHEVGIWTDSGTLLASGTVAAGTADSLDSGFRMASIGPVNMDAGKTYVIAAYYDSSDTDGVVTGAAAALTAPGITYLQRAYDIAPGAFTFPTGANSLNPDAIFGPTFGFAYGAVVPEPATFVSCGTAACAGLIAFGWRRRRRADAA